MGKEGDGGAAWWDLREQEEDFLEGRVAGGVKLEGKSQIYPEFHGCPGA